MSRNIRARIGAALGLALVAASTVSAGAVNAAPPTMQELLDRPRAGGDAVRALGLQIASAATRNGVSVAALRDELLRDKSVWLDSQARRYVVEPTTAFAPTGNENTTPLSSIPDADTFLLHSKAGSNRVVYLDFDGEVVQNTAWNQNYSSGAAFAAAPYDSDGIPSTFNATELNVVKSVWQRVAEDYAAFDVDVTTQAPDPSAITRTDANDQTYGTRALITNTSTVYSSCSCGGVAYVGTFDVTSSHSYYQPAFVFQRGLGSGAKNLAEATSHEVGHNLGLSHDGSASTGYYSGHGAWAPIMGVGYSKPISQWSRGEYTGASNTEDDFVVMQANGAALRADDYGNAAASAHTLTGATATLSGRISTAADVDAFSITAGSGSATFNVAPAPTSPNLDASLTVLDANGAQVALNDPATATVSSDTASGMGASLSLTLAAGKYTVMVAGVGYGDPRSTGYSDYGSVGAYTLTASVTPPTSTPPPANVAPTARMTPTSASGVAPVTIAFNGTTSSDTDGTIASYAWNFGNGSTATGATPSHTYTAAGTYTVTLTVTDNAGATGTATGTVSVTAPPTNTVPAAPTAASATRSLNTVTVKWTDRSSNETGFYVYRERWNSYWRRWESKTRVATMGANATSYSGSMSTGTYRYSVVAYNSVGQSAAAVTNSVTR
ncbi:MAG: PKD domain-containing protein [Acidimicrobiales bacterium]|nr:PKD domain-containing protein [Acidimicrobiales bacterium]